MKYALLVYDVPGSWHDLSTEQKHALHGEYQAVADSPGVIGHFRLRPPQKTTTVSVVQDQIVKTEGRRCSIDGSGSSRARPTPASVDLLTVSIARSRSAPRRRSA